MSNQIGRSLVRTMFSPASIRSFFNQRPGVVGSATVILSWTGLNYWDPDPRRLDVDYAMACSERRIYMEDDLETLAREMDAIKAKQSHARGQKEDKTKADNQLLRAG